MAKVSLELGLFNPPFTIGSTIRTQAPELWSILIWAGIIHSQMGPVVVGGRRPPEEFHRLITSTTSPTTAAVV